MEKMELSNLLMQKKRKSFYMIYKKNIFVIQSYSQKSRNDDVKAYKIYVFVFDSWQILFFILIKAFLLEG